MLVVLTCRELQLIVKVNIVIVHLANAEFEKMDSPMSLDLFIVEGQDAFNSRVEVCEVCLYENTCT